jgi:uncharacterized protein YfiM (DUF2279 family)
MKKISKLMLSVITAIILTTNAHADSWYGEDKVGHFVMGAGVATAVTVATGNEWYGFAAGTAVGALKEVYDYKHRDKHTPSFKDFAVTAVGALVGAKFGGLMVTPNRITYRIEF